MRAALTAAPSLRLVSAVRPGAEAAREASRLRPAAILLAADLPGHLLLPLVRDLRAASDASAVVVIGARAALDGVTLRALLDLGVRGCLTWEDVAPEAWPHYLLTALAGGVVSSPGLLAALGGAHDRRWGGRLEGLALTPHERALARGRAATETPERARVALWGHDPTLAAGMELHVTQAGLTLEVVDTAEALRDAASRSVALVIDCTGAPDALERCLVIVPRVAPPVPVLICHPDEGFVADLRPHATADLVWLPPAWLGARLRDKLRLLGAPSDAVPTGAPTHLPFTEREREVRLLDAAGRTVAQIAAHLGVSENTAKTHLANIRRKVPLLSPRPSASDARED